jgi:hypothetical protein
MRSRTWLGLGAAVLGAFLVWLLWRGGEAAPGGRAADDALPSAGADKRAPPSRATTRAEIHPTTLREEAGKEPVDGLLVTVVNAEDRPVAGAVVATCDPEAAHPAIDDPGFPTAVTRDDGTARVRLDLPLGAAHLLVLAKGHVPELVRVESRERQRVRLDGEALLRGKVLVGGKPPPEPLALDVYGYGYLADASRAIHAFLERHGWRYMQIPFDTDARGEFAVRGLLRGGTCVIALPEGYAYVRPGEGIVTCDGTPVTLELKTRNVLTGRIVAAPGSPRKEPRGVLLRYELESRAPGCALARGAVPAVVGEKFLIRFEEPSLFKITLEVWEGAEARRRIGLKTIEREVVGSADLGDVALPEPRTVAFVVKDPDGRRLAGARALAFGTVSEPSGADGKTTLAIDAAARAAVVGAPGYSIESVPLPDPPPPSLEVRLERACTLVARVRHDDPGEPARGLFLFVGRDADGAGVAADAAPEFSDVRISKRVREAWWPGPGSGQESVHGPRPGHQGLWYEVHAGQNIVVGGFRKTDELRLRVEDAFLNILQNMNATFAEGDTKVVELVVKQRPRVLRGVVTGDRGEPLPGAVVGFHMFSLSGRDPHLPADTGIPCDAAGRFEVPDVYADDPGLMVAAPGHIPRNVRWSELAESPAVALDRARRLVVELTGPPGRQEGMSGNAILELRNGEQLSVGKRSPDHFVFESVPCRPGRLKIALGAAELLASVDADDVRVQVARVQ